MLGPDEWTQGAQRQAHSHSTSFPSAEVDALTENESPFSDPHQGRTAQSWAGLQWTVPLVARTDYFLNF